MEVSRMKVVDEVVRALGASMLTILLMVTMTATMTTASDYYKVYEYTTTVYRLAWVNGRFTIFSDSGSFQLYSWDFTGVYREIEGKSDNWTVLRHVTIEYYGLDYYSGSGCIIYQSEEIKEKVDWPVNIVFYGPKVSKSFVYDFFKALGLVDIIASVLSELFSDKYMYLKNYNTSWEWDSDGGAKVKREDVAYLIGWAYDCRNADGSYVFLHLRFYASSQPSGEFFSDGNLRYVVATAHFDRDETLFGGRGSGWSECAEKFLVDYIGANAGSKGYTVRISKDYDYGYNWIDYDGWRAIGLHAITIRKSVDDFCKYIEYTKGIEDNGLYHVYLNNGWVTYIYVDK
jgi:hypothetical protein